ncbi:MAG: hypothetical protein HYX56_03655 [Chloroflexi bacterium]|nr:hypothetical protein [Chloroflexota bacterium]
MVNDLDRFWAPRWRRIALFVTLFFAVGLVTGTLVRDSVLAGPKEPVPTAAPVLSSPDASPARVVPAATGLTPPPFVPNAPPTSPSVTTAPPATSAPAATPRPTTAPTAPPTKTP